MPIKTNDTPSVVPHEYTQWLVGHVAEAVREGLRELDKPVQDVNIVRSPPKYQLATASAIVVAGVATMGLVTVPPGKYYLLRNLFCASETGTGFATLYRYNVSRANALLSWDTIDYSPASPLVAFQGNVIVATFAGSVNAEQAYIGAEYEVVDAY